MDVSAEGALQALDPYLLGQLRDHLTVGAPAASPWDMRLVAARTGRPGPDGTPPVAERLADGLGVGVIAPDGEMLVLRGGELFSAGPGAGWLEFRRERRRPERAGPRYPVPPWQAALPPELGGPGTLGARGHPPAPGPVEVTAIPAGLWVRVAGCAPRPLADLGFGVPVEPARPVVLVGAPGEPVPRLEGLNGVVDSLATALRDTFVLAPYGQDSKTFAELAQGLADRMGAAVRVYDGLPCYAADSTRRFVVFGESGRPDRYSETPEKTYLPGTASPSLDVPPPVASSTGEIVTAKAAVTVDARGRVRPMRPADLRPGGAAGGASPGILRERPAEPVPVAGVPAGPAAAFRTTASTAVPEFRPVSRPVTAPSRTATASAAVAPPPVHSRPVDMAQVTGGLPEEPAEMPPPSANAPRPVVDLALPPDDLVSPGGTALPPGDVAGPPPAGPEGAPPAAPGSVTGPEPEAAASSDETLLARREAPSSKVDAMPASDPERRAWLADRASTPEERQAFRDLLGKRYETAARGVARLLAEHPGLRSVGTVDEAMVTDLAAVRVFAASDQSKFVESVRSGGSEGDRPLAVCVAAGLRRLPSLQGVVVRGGPADPSVADAYVPGQDLIEAAPMVALAGLDAQVTGGVEILIWSSTARRLSGLAEGARADEVAFLPGTVFRVLAVDPLPTAADERPPVRRVLLAEMVSGRSKPVNSAWTDRMLARLEEAAAERAGLSPMATDPDEPDRFAALPGDPGQGPAVPISRGSRS
ncbi:hypothetical protein [Actinoallomurus sp. NPDC050550]|uniref:hypothetical protein n=1 Tax=Actinoallomurus sp. NPDC050550 TaxID=3154937 RepID=UPI0033C87665